MDGNNPERQLKPASNLMHMKYTIFKALITDGKNLLLRILIARRLFEFRIEYSNDFWNSNR